MWEKLENLQKEVYGPDNQVILYTLKNKGICLMAMEKNLEARTIFNQCLTMIN